MNIRYPIYEGVYRILTLDHQGLLYSMFTDHRFPTGISISILGASARSYNKLFFSASTVLPAVLSLLAAFSLGFFPRFAFVSFSFSAFVTVFSVSVITCLLSFCGSACTAIGAMVVSLSIGMNSVSSIMAACSVEEFFPSFSSG